MANRRAYVMLLTDNLNNEKFADLLNKHIKKHPVGMMYLDIKRFGEIERRYGQKLCDRILQILKQLLLEVENDGTKGVFAHRMFGDDVFLFVELDEGDRKQILMNFRQSALDLRTDLEEKLNDYLVLADEQIELHVGAALLDTSMNGSTEVVLYNSIKEAIHEAKSEADEEYAQKRKEFLDVLTGKEITAHYQPIVCLASGGIHGYEALSRGPEGSFFASPLRLLDFAEKEGSLYTLEKIARERAIQGFSVKDPAHKLFINMNANVIHDPHFTPGQTLQLLEQTGLTPQNVVFEITERQSIDDYATITRTLDHYRKQGYRIAIDDAGAGYSSLQAIAEIRPDYIKIDRSTVEIEHARDSNPLTVTGQPPD
ncbi:EAL domain-containing protein [Effusibacillus consociatus]|uniref:EAL domain-containing protein n=1 Tax=Effusibacillus consociatus TaxID=1117041 RepID=A0ABV9Q1A6_9BACL